MLDTLRLTVLQALPLRRRANPDAETDAPVTPVMECPVAPDLLADAALSHLDLQQISYSSRHHLEIKLRRTQQKQEKLVDRAQKQLAAIYEVWSRSCLARGERLQSGTVRRRARKPEKKPVWQYPRAWTMRGTLREAFRAIGMVCSSASGTRKTRRELDAISYVALSHRNYVDSQVNCT